MLLFTLAKVAIICSVPMSFNLATDGVKVITSLECRVKIMSAESENQQQGNPNEVIARTLLNGSSDLYSATLLHLTSCVFMKSVDTSTFYYLVIKASHNFRINFQQEISCSTIQSSL